MVTRYDEGYMEKCIDASGVGNLLAYYLYSIRRKAY